VIDDPVEEIYYRKGDIDFCFLLNRRHHNLRVFDYRVGNYQQKRDFFDRIARAEGLRKVFTVVEKQDSKSWRSVGFSREGAIPGYFRTADAYIMSRVYTDEGEPIQGGAPKLTVPPLRHRQGAKEKDLKHTKPRGLTFEVINDIAKLQEMTRESARAASTPRSGAASSTPTSPSTPASTSASTGSAPRPTAPSATPRSTC
jgi:hypothetical protein